MAILTRRYFSMVIYLALILLLLELGISNSHHFADLIFQLDAINPLLPIFPLALGLFLLLLIPFHLQHAFIRPIRLIDHFLKATHQKLPLDALRIHHASQLD